MSQTILIAGGTGFLGSRLAEMFRNKGYGVRILTRKPGADGQYAWDPRAGVIDEQSVAGADVVVNLAGAGIAEQRWTPARKQLLIDSRVQSARLLREAFQRLGHQPKAYLAASAIGFYGNSGERWVAEDDAPAGGGFMVECCTAWEQAAETIGAMGIRTVIFRTGIALDRPGGALREIIKPLRFGMGAYFGDGRAWYSWIHRDDLCRAYLWAAENPGIEGVFNAVAPQPVRNVELVKAVVRAMRRPAVVMPAPEFALRLVFGEMADAILFSNRVAAEKIIRAGFHFQFPQLPDALADIFKNKRT